MTNTYFKRLVLNMLMIGMSFFNILTYPTVSSARIFKPTLRLRMHDMVDDLARHTAGDELWYTNGAENINTMRDKLNCK